MLTQVLAVLLSLQSAGPATDSATSGPSACELHVWAAPGLGMTLQTAKDNFVSGLGPNGGGALGGVLTREFGGDPKGELERDKRDVHTERALPQEPFSNARQLEILQSLELPQLLGTRDYRAVFHAEVLDNNALKSPARYAQAPAACYADLVVSDVVYSREYANGQNLKSFVRFRDFGSGQAPVRKLSTWVQTKLAHPREGKKANVEGSNAELPQALAENLRKFAGYLGKVK